MSFIQTDNGELAKMLWPEDVGYILDEPTAVAGCEQWQLIPNSFEALCDWAYLARNRQAVDRSHSHNMLYKSPQVQGTMFTITLRLQGYVGSCSLSAFGSWSGDAGTASSAIQFLTLSSGGNLEPWIATHDTIRNVRQLAHNSMPSRTRYIEPEPDYTRDIYLRRRVFTKSSQTRLVESVELKPDDDPNGYYPAISSDWAVASRLQIGRRLSDNRVTKCSALAINDGDFVDVAVEIDVATSRGRDNQNRVRVHLAMVHVLRLAKAERLVVNHGGTIMTTPAIGHESAPNVAQHSGFVFDTITNNSGDDAIDDDMNRDIQVSD